MLDHLLKLLPHAYLDGVLQFAAPWQWLLVGWLFIAILVVWFYGLRRRGESGPSGRIWCLAGLRFLILGVVLALLFKPVLWVPLAEGIRGSVAVLVDDSLSMTIVDGSGVSRAGRVRELFDSDTDSFSTQLERSYTTRYFRFARGLEPWDVQVPLQFSGPTTDIEAVLETLSNQPQDPPLAAAVLVSDGAQPGGQISSEVLQALRAAGIVVHTVGVGETRERDVELVEVGLPDRVLVGDRVGFEVTLRHSGFAEREVALIVEDADGVVAHRELVTLGPNDGTQRVNLELAFGEAGPQELTFRVNPPEGEEFLANNQVREMLQVRGQPLRILHVEGEPRFEVKFLRRAVSGDQVLRLVSLIQTAENKFYRIGVETPEELAEGFPTTAEALFAYRALILGSVQAASLSLEQQALIRDFVGRRGGSLLLLGGNQSFAEGGYQDSALAGLLPVTLAPADGLFRAAVKVEPTGAGRLHPVLQLASEDHPGTHWDGLPPLNVVNPIRDPKPSATVLLEGRDQGGDDLVILAWHRYGRGSVGVFSVRDSWRWQLHPDVAVEDQTHELFWGQLLRWLVRGTNGQLEVDIDSSLATPGEIVTVRADILNAAFEPWSNVKPELLVTTPLGDIQRYALPASVREHGQHETAFTVTETGRYDLAIVVGEDDQVALQQVAYVDVTESGQEFHNADLNSELLTTISDATGGRYFPVDQAARVAEVVDDVVDQQTTLKRVPLWNLPLLLLVLLLFLSLEWIYRRRSSLR